MTRGSIGCALLLAAALAAGTAEAGIEKLESCGLTWGGDTVGLARGRANDVTVTGFGVDLATSVDTTAPNTPVTVVSRKNGFGSNIVIRLVPPDVGDSVSATVNLRYFGGGVDTFSASVSAGPSVTSIAFAPGGGVSTSGGTTRVTSLDSHVVVLKGTNLDALQLNAAEFQRSGMREARVVLQLPGELRVSFTSDAGARGIGSPLFRSGFCDQRPPDFSFAFTVFDPPRTPTPTPTATRTPTRPALHAPVIFTPVKGPSFLPTRTPTPAPAKPKGLR